MTGQRAGGGDQVAHIGIVRAELQRRIVSLGRFGMPAEAGQRVPEQPEQARIGDADLPRRLGQRVGGGEIAPPDRRQHGGVAQFHPAGDAGDAGGERGAGAFGIPAGGLRRGQGLDEGGVGGFRVHRLRQAGDRVDRPAELGHQHAEDRLAGGIARVERHRLRRIDRGGHVLAATVAHIGAQPAQSGMGRRRRHREVEFRRRTVELPGRQCKPRRKLRRRRPGRGEATEGGQHGARGVQLAGVDHFAHAAAEDVGIGLGGERIHWWGSF